MNNGINSYIKENYNGYLLLPKKDGASDGFILEKSSEPSPKRIYFKSDGGFLADHFVLSIFSRVSVKAPESKVHYIKDGKLGFLSSDFYLSTNGMSRSYQKKGIMKSQAFLDDLYGVKEAELTKDQLDKFRASLAKLRLLIYVFGLTDISINNVGYLEKHSNKSTAFKFGIIDFLTPVSGNWCSQVDYNYNINMALLFGMFSQAKFVEILNRQVDWILLPGKRGYNPIELTLDEYKQAFYSIANPTIKEFNANGYLVSNSLGKKTKFNLVVQNVFDDIQKECSAIGSTDPIPFKHLSNYLGKVKKYKNIVTCRFQDVEAIINGRSIHRFITFLIKEMAILSIALYIFLSMIDLFRTAKIDILDWIASSILLLIWRGLVQEHFITSVSILFHLYYGRFLSFFTSNELLS